MGLLIPRKALASVWCHTGPILTFTTAEGNTFRWIRWTVDESLVACAGIWLCTCSVDAGRITSWNASIPLEYKSLYAVATVWTNTGSTSTIRYIRITFRHAYMGLHCFQESTEALASVQPNTVPIQARRFTGRNTPLLRIRCEPIPTGALPGCYARSMATLGFTNRNTDSQLLAEARVARAAVRCDARAILAPVADRFARSLRRLLVALAAHRLGRGFVVDRAGIDDVVVGVDLLFVLEDALPVTGGVTTDFPIGRRDVRRSGRNKSVIRKSWFG